MPTEHAVPEKEQDKKHGDKLENALDSVLDKGIGLTQDASSKGTGPVPQQEPLK